jgi:ABC-type multidrug transport system fused ATPase/permease subunit
MPLSRNKKAIAITRNTFLAGVKIIARNLKPHKRILIILTIAGLLNATAQAFVPLISGKIFDAIIQIAQNSHSVLVPLTPVFILIGIWLFLQLASNVVGWWTGFENDKLSTYLSSEYISDGYAKLFEMPLSFHTSQKQGDVSDRVTRAANWLDSIVDNVLLTLLPSFLSIIVALVITTLINGILTLILIVAIVVYVIILWMSVPALTDLQKKMHRAYNRAYGDAYDALGNVKEIKQAATEKEEKRKIRYSFIDRAAQFWVNMNTISQRLNFAQKVLVTLTQLSIFVCSIFFVRDGILTPGGLVAFNGYAAMMLGPFVMLGQQWQTVQTGLVALTRSENILETPTEIYAPVGGVSPKKIQGDIVFENVSFGYKKGLSETLKGISFHARPGEKIALVGESGVGKTTLIDLLCAFYFPNQGRIIVDGIDIRKINLTAYRSRIGVVPQEPALFNDTLERNIRYGNPKATRAEMLAAVENAHASEFIEKFPKKYRQTVGHRGVKLSVGQKQRIALARAFLRNPDILILDEPTSALDAQSEQLIKNSLEKLMQGRTTFIIAHRLSTVREVDTILVLRNGEIIERGSHDQLVAIEDGAYRKLYQLQTGFAG